MKTYEFNKKTKQLVINALKKSYIKTDDVMALATITKHWINTTVYVFQLYNKNEIYALYVRSRKNKDLLTFTNEAEAYKFILHI